MKRRILSLLLAAVLTAAALPGTGLAAGWDAVPTRTYQGQFTDVAPTDWYYENVAALYALGLTDGQGSGDTFAPAANITLAEAVTMAARLRSLYASWDPEAGPSAFSQGDNWYEPYVAYAKTMGIIGGEFDGLYDQGATRAQVAHILAHALPESLMDPINEKAVTVGYASRRYISDVDEYTPYQGDILSLYRWGILSGADATGSFLPEAAIRRSEIAAMLTRLADSSLRITLDWDLALAYSKTGTDLKDLVTSTGAFHSAPDPGDSAAVDDNLRYMLSRGERRMTLSYGPGVLTAQLAEEVMSAFLDGVRSYAEQGYNAVRCSYSLASGSLILTFACSLYDERMIDAYRAATMEAAVQVHDQLWREGTITAAMSDYDKARVYFTWLCGHCRYDYQSGDASMSHSGYSALVDGLAVCDGYTAAYNLLLKLEGIDCTTASTADHLWTVADLDGQWVHIDPTWGDQAAAVDYRYFAMTEEASFGRFA